MSIWCDGDTKRGAEGTETPIAVKGRGMGSDVNNTFENYCHSIRMTILWQKGIADDDDDAILPCAEKKLES